MSASVAQQYGWRRRSGAPVMAGAGRSGLDRALCWEQGLRISGAHLPFFKNPLKSLQVLESSSPLIDLPAALSSMLALARHKYGSII